MSEAENQAISILLPSSGVAVYSQDKETLQAAKDVTQDWRFARVKVEAHEGDVNTAIKAYKNTSSPELIIVQTEKIDDSLPQQLEDLASNCDEGTAAIVIGPVNDVDLYRRLIEMGVSDYLVKPIEAPVLADVIAKTLIEQIGATGSRLIAFVGAKGGVGATVLAEASACGVADILDQKTILIDGAGGWSTLGVGMGFDPSTTLAEAVRAAANDDEDSLNRMLFKASDKLSVLASGGDMMLEPSVKPDQLEVLIDMLMVKYPVVIADISHTSPELEKAVIARANQVMVVSSPTLPALRLARTLINEIKEVRGDEDSDIELIINMQGLDAADEVPKGDIEQAVGLGVSSIIPFASKIFIKAESESRKLTDDKEGVEIIKKSLLPLIQKVLSVESDAEETASDKQGLFGGFLNKLKVKS